jgi:hypothetical protein
VVSGRYALKSKTIDAASNCGPRRPGITVTSTTAARVARWASSVRACQAKRDVVGPKQIRDR